MKLVMIKKLSNLIKIFPALFLIVFASFFIAENTLAARTCPTTPNPLFGYTCPTGSWWSKMEDQAPSSCQPEKTCPADPTGGVYNLNCNTNNCDLSCTSPYVNCSGVCQNYPYPGVTDPNCTSYNNCTNPRSCSGCAAGYTLLGGVCTGASLKLNFDSILSDRLKNSTNVSPAITVLPDNSVGIGTTTPDTVLKIVGSGRIVNVSGAKIAGLDLSPLLPDEAVPLGYLQANYLTTASTSFWSGSLAGNIWNANNGSIGVGTNNPGAKLDINGGVLVRGTNNLSFGGILTVQSPTTAGASWRRGFIGSNLYWNETAGNWQSNAAGGGDVAGISFNNAGSLSIIAKNGYTQPRTFTTAEVDAMAIMNFYTDNKVSIPTGSLGVGTSNPSQKLDVVGSGKFSAGTAALPGVMIGNNNDGIFAPVAGQVAITTSGRNTATFVSSSATDVRFQINTTNYSTMFGQYEGDWFGTTNPMIMQPLSPATAHDIALTGTQNNPGNGLVIKADGKIGFGLAGPAAKVDIYNSAGGFARGLKISNNASNAEDGVYIQLNSASSPATNDGYGPYIGSRRVIGGGGHLVFGSGTDTNILERMRITADGKVGIASTTPINRLVVIPFGGSSDNSINVGGANIGGLNLTPLNRDQAVPLGYLQDNYSSPVWSGVKNNNIWNGDSGAGNVGIGTNSPGAKLDVQNLTSSTTPSISLLGGGAYGSGYHVSWGNYSKLSQNSSGVNFITWGAYHNGASWVRSYSGGVTGLVNLAIGNGNYFSIQTDSQASPNTPSWTDVLTVNGTQVGIGTTGPGHKLDVNGAVRAERYRGINSLSLASYGTVNPASNVFIYSQPNDRDSWIYLDSTDTGSNWGIYHRQIDSAVSGLPANSIGFVGGGASALQAYISLANGSAFFNGSVGIGTTTVPEKLTITGGGLSLRATGLTSKYIIDTNWSASAGDFFSIKNSAAASSQLLISSSGNVGISTTSPSAKMHIDGGAGIVLNVSGGRISGLNLMPLLSTDAVPLGYLQANYFPTSSSLWAGSLAGNIWSANSGNVGIGTTTPAAKLHVFGNQMVGDGSQNSLLTGSSFQIQKNSGNATAISLWQNGVASSIIGHKASDSNLYITNNYSNPGLGSSAYSITLNSNGSVGIGTTSPIQKLSVVGNIYGTGAIFGSNPTYPTSINDTGIVFNNLQQTVPATYPSSQKGFTWNISSDGAWMKAYEMGGDSLEYEFGMRDNITAPDRFVWKLNEWRGVHAGLESMVLYNGSGLYLNQPTYQQGSLFLQAPRLATQLLPNRIDNTLGAQSISVIRNNQAFWNPDVGASTLVMTPNVSGYTGTIARGYVIKIKNTSNPNTFSWGVGSQGGDVNVTTNWIGNDIPVSTSPITLDYGVTITFNSTTGGVANETFGFTVLPGASLAGNSTSNSYLMGRLGIGTTTPAGVLSLNTGVNSLSFSTADPALWNYNNTQYLRFDDLSIYSLNVLGGLRSTAGNLYIDGTGTSRIMGKLAIASTTASSPLDVTGLIKMRVATSSISANEDVVNKEYLDYKLSSTSSGGEYVGVTTATANGNNTGYAGAHAICVAQYPGSHVCSGAEILNSIVKGKYVTAAAGTYWIFNGPPAYTAQANDCNGRTSAASNVYGAIWVVGGAPQGYGMLTGCNNSNSFVCCK
jgi:hypothetical protein